MDYGSSLKKSKKRQTKSPSLKREGLFLLDIRRLTFVLDVGCLTCYAIIMIRKFKFAQNNYYHICNRSNDETPIFFDERDYSRFLFFILAYQAPLSFYN